MSKIRLDKACLAYLSTRAKAQDAIKESRVLVNGNIVIKCSYLVDEEDEIQVLEKDNDFVSRAGHKLQGAFDHFQFDIHDQVVLDVGASTGGFTDVFLRHGAKKVYALDVGHLQLAKTLEEDDRVIKMEGRNAREILPSWFDEPIDFMCMDVSFISCKTILSHIFEVLNIGHMAILVKPQFECGPNALNKHGVLKNQKLALQIVEDVCAFMYTKYKKVDYMPSVLEGRSGNQEYVIYASELR